MANFKYYVYRHLRLDKNQVFYIGQGTKPNVFTSFKREYSRAFDIQRRNAYWNSIVKITEYDVEILYESNSIEEINNKEIEFIELYGRKDLNKGTLANQCSGGHTTRGRMYTEEQKRKFSEIQKGRVYKPAGWKHTEETKQKLKDSWKKRKLNG